MAKSALFNTGYKFDTFATKKDIDVCKKLCACSKLSYPVLKRWIPKNKHDCFTSVYAFIRHLNNLKQETRKKQMEKNLDSIRNYRSEIIKSIDGIPPKSPYVRAFSDVLKKYRISLDEPLYYLKSTEQDMLQNRYPHYDSLQQYMRGSSGAFVMILAGIFQLELNTFQHQSLIAFSEAMQLTLFLRNLKKDALNNKIYFPKDDLSMFYISEHEILYQNWSPRFTCFVKYQIKRIENLFAVAEEEYDEFPYETKKFLQNISHLSRSILRKIESYNYDVFEIENYCSPIDILKLKYF